jgi:BlaI family transcriptional regulator, penicillinase repressor
MARKSLPGPTPTEIEILGILWERGPSTVRDVHERLGSGRSVGYTGVLKLLQNMFAKGLVRRDQSAHAHVYEALEPARMRRQLLRDFMQRAFGGSASQMVQHLLDDEIASPAEIEHMRRMLASHRRKTR